MKSFGRFIYYGRFSGHAHFWSTTDPPSYGARIALSEDGSIDHTAPGGITYPAPTKEEVATAQSMVKPAAPKPEWDFGRFKYQGLIDSLHRWFAGDFLNPVAQIWLDTNGGKGVCITDGEDKPATEEEIASAEALVKGSSFAQQRNWDFGRFKYRGKFEVLNSHMPIESKHTWATYEPRGAKSAKIGLREDGSLSFTCKTDGHPNPTAFEIAKAQALVKHELADGTVFEETDAFGTDIKTQTHVQRGSTPNVQKLLYIAGDPRIVRSFGRFIFLGRGDDGRAHWSTHERNPELGAQIILKKNGGVICAKMGVIDHVPTPEEVHTAQAILTEAERFAEEAIQELTKLEGFPKPKISSVNMLEHPQCPRRWSYGMSEPPVDVGGSVFQHLLKLLTPKEDPPMAKSIPSEIKPHVLSIPLRNAPLPALNHYLYSEHYGTFKIAGLAMWNVSEDTTVNLHINNQAVFEGEVPAQMFANGLSFNELYQLLELKEPPDRFIHQDVSNELIAKLQNSVKWRPLEEGLIPTLRIAEGLELLIRGPAKHAVFWGYRRRLL